MIGVVPEENLLVIVTGALADDQSPDDLLRKYVLPAIQADDALPPNTEATTRLTSAVAAAAHPAPTMLPLLPPIAQKISGKTFPVIENIGLFDALIPHFTAASATATFTFIIGSDTVDLTVGLDGVYAINETQVPLALRASWKTDNSLLLEWQWIGDTQTLLLLLTFNNGSVDVQSGTR
ncbi:MAG TPA: hypothetical protein VHO69_07435, partial [Phototrophicaceae bacterium]|nr:hypothetical protein [Phototrophicaceae bacterium]